VALLGEINVLLMDLLVPLSVLTVLVPPPRGVCLDKQISLGPTRAGGFTRVGSHETNNVDSFLGQMRLPEVEEEEVLWPKSPFRIPPVEWPLYSGATLVPVQAQASLHLRDLKLYLVQRLLLPLVAPQPQHT